MLSSHRAHIITLYVCQYIVDCLHGYYSYIMLFFTWEFVQDTHFLEIFKVNHIGLAVYWLAVSNIWSSEQVARLYSKISLSEYFSALKYLYAGCLQENKTTCTQYYIYTYSV